LKATDWELNQEEVEVVVVYQEVLMNRPKWKPSEHWRTDMGTGI
jgi:hypothetical protein